MNHSGNFDKNNSEPSFDSLTKSLNESLNKPTPLAGVTRTRPTNFKPAAIPPPPPPPPSKNK